MRAQSILLLVAGCAIGLAGCMGDPYADLMRSRQNLVNQYAVKQRQLTEQARSELDRGTITEAEYRERIQEIDKTWGPAAAQSDIREAHRLTTPNYAPTQTPAPSWQPTYTSSYQANSSQGASSPPAESPTMGDTCQYMSCPAPPAPPKTYIPVSPGDPLNAGLDSSGKPTN